MRKFLLTLTVMALPALAQAQVIFANPAQAYEAISGFTGSAASTDQTCLLVKYRGTTVGKPTVEAAANGDVTFKIAGVADTTTGSPSLNGIFDLSTPAAAVDTVGELVTLINTTGSNWVAVPVACLASESTDNLIPTLSATEAAGVAGARLFRDTTTSLAARVAVVEPGREADIRPWLTGNKPNQNPFAGFQSVVNFVYEKITSTGTIGAFRVLGVTPNFSANGSYSETVRTIFSVTGAATTVASSYTFPQFGGAGEKIIVDQSSGTDLTAVVLEGNGYTTKARP